MAANIGSNASSNVGTEGLTSSRSDSEDMLMRSMSEEESNLLSSRGGEQGGFLVIAGTTLRLEAGADEDDCRSGA